MQVQKTIGVVEALDERIKLLDEDIAKVQTEILKARTKNAGGSIGHTLLRAALVGFAVILALVLASNDAGAPGLIVVVLAVVVAWKWKNTGGIDVASLEAKLLELRSERDARAQEKRDLVLGFERQIRADAAPISANIEREIAAASADTKTCPMCAETVKAAAKICKHCRHQFDA